jgi:hypothetical protein
MIKVTGSITRAFIFPASTKDTLIYYSDLPRIIQYMPHINLVEDYGNNEVRVLYKTVELGAYTIRIYCDMRGQVDETNKQLIISPLQSALPVEANATASISTAQGVFGLQANLFDLDDHTRAEYHIQLQAVMPRPLGMRLMPKRVVNRIAQNVASSRIREIADGFIKASIDAYPDWAAANQPLSS